MDAKKWMLGVVSLSFIFSSSLFAADSVTLDEALQKLSETYLAKYKTIEHISGVAMSVSLPRETAIRSYFAGKVSADENAAAIDKNTLFQIGSITKSFVAAVILQLEAEGKLNINDKLGKYLPQYPAWKDITLKQLLNMTSGIPDYNYSDMLEKKVNINLSKQWKPEDIIQVIYPALHKSAAYEYSNTNYLLVGLIIEKVTQHSVQEEIEKRLLLANGLENTFYANGFYPKAVTSRLAHGYYYDDSFKGAFYGKDVSHMNMSFAGAAGGMLSDTVDLVRWVKLLYGIALYPQAQLDELTSLVSTKSGMPILTTSSEHPDGFGLAVAQTYNPDVGRFWYYEGETLGFRALYFYQPCNHLVITIALNSAVNTDKGQDHISELLGASYDRILTMKPEYQCKQ